MNPAFFQCWHTAAFRVCIAAALFVPPFIILLDYLIQASTLCNIPSSGRTDLLCFIINAETLFLLFLRPQVKDWTLMAHVLSKVLCVSSVKASYLKAGYLSVKHDICVMRYLQWKHEPDFVKGQSGFEFDLTLWLKKQLWTFCWSPDLQQKKVFACQWMNLSNHLDS